MIWSWLRYAVVAVKKIHRPKVDPNLLTQAKASHIGSVLALTHNAIGSSHEGRRGRS